VSRGERAFVVLAGRQVAAREDLEVLALGTTARHPDGQPIREVLAWARAQDALPVVPWGPGKWLGARAALLRALVEEARGQELYLGDESSRPISWSPPRPFAWAEAHGVRNLPGTDPLPFPRERTRAGGYGFWTDGALESPLRFVRNQIAMQLRKRRRAAAHAP